MSLEDGCATLTKLIGENISKAIKLLPKKPERIIASGGGRKNLSIMKAINESTNIKCESIEKYGKNLPFRHTVIFGGVGQKPQVNALRRGVNILIATPGRLIDLMDQGYVHLEEVSCFILDEVDRMLDMGFIHAIRRILKVVPSNRQTLFFSATMPKSMEKLSFCWLPSRCCLASSMRTLML